MRSSKIRLRRCHMSRAADEFRQVDYLIELAMEGAITPDQAQELNALILTHPAVCRHYCEYVQLTMNIERLSAKLPVTDLNEYTTVFDQALWDQLAHEEMSAPVMELPQAGPAQRSVSPAAQKTARPKNKFRIVAAMSSAAAAVVLVLFARFARCVRIEVATVSDCMDAKGKVGSFEIGSRVTNRLWPIVLTSGYLKLTFDYGAEVILEGPAEFQIISAEQMRLLQGKLTAVVPREAVGFRVDTPGASVIDLGTEFSLEVEQDGSTSVHLFEGNASLVAGKPGNRQSCPITAGQAKQIRSRERSGTSRLLRGILFVVLIHAEKRYGVSCRAASLGPELRGNILSAIGRWMIRPAQVLCPLAIRCSTRLTSRPSRAISAPWFWTVVPD